MGQKQKPFDIVIGFSQGAAVATLLMNAFEQGRSNGATVDPRSNLLAAVKPPKLVACICGVSPHFLRDASTPEISTACLRTRSVHIIGEKDAFKEEGLALARDWYGAEDGNTVERRSCTGRLAMFTHEKGHCFPPDASVLAHMLREQLAEAKKESALMQKATAPAPHE